MDPKGTQFLLLFLIFLCTQGSKFNGDSIPGCIPIERSALLEFKEGLKVPTHRLSSWVGEECCTWEGVTCDNRTGHVVKLDLHNPHLFSITDDLFHDNWSLGGELRPSLLDLKHLNYLDLSRNNFGGIRIPKFLGSFHQLKYLNLSTAGLGGLIPHQLGNLSSLQYLDFSNDLAGNLASFNDISIDNARWISHLSSMRYLNMGSVNVKDGANWLQALNMLPSIVEIELSYCDIHTIPLSLPHMNFTSLSILDLSYNSIDSAMPGWLFNITSLECLYLGGGFSRVFIPPAIKNLASLKFLDLSSIPSLEGKIPSELGGLCKLQYLDLSFTNISKKLQEFDEVFNGCIKHSLETLRMERCHLSGYLPNGLGDFRKLKDLSLWDNSISGPIPASLGRLSSLQQLDLSFNMMNGTPPGSLGRLAEIVELDLGYNFLDGVVSEEHFANLTKLMDLRLSGNQLILKVGPDWIPPFQLQSLDIGSCKLGPRFPAWLRTQENISNLYMFSTGISDTIPDWFWRSFSQIESLEISSNGISGSLPDLTDFINLSSFVVSSNYFEGPLPNFPSTVTQLYGKFYLHRGFC